MNNPQDTKRPAILPLLILTVLTGILTTCGDPLDIFSAYRGQNLLESQNLSTESWVLHESTAPGTSGALMAFDDVTGQNLAAPPEASGAVYRLELKNQLANGDFEDGSDPPDQWSTEDTGTDLVFGTAGNPGTDSFWWLSGQVLHHVSAAAQDSYAYIDLAAYLSTFPTQAPAREFTIHFSMQLPGDQFSYSFGFWDTPGGTYNPTATVSVQPDSDLSIYRTFPSIDTAGQFYPGNTANTVTLGPGNMRYLSLEQTASNLNLHFDNFRIVQTQSADLSYSLETGLTRVDDAKRADFPLQSGSYEFSLYVRPDPVVTPDPDGRNRYPGRYITLQILGNAGSASKTFDLWQGNPKEGYTQPEGWTKLTLTGENLVGSLYGVAGDDEVLRIQVIPAAIGKQVYDPQGEDLETSYPNEDAGSFLITAPHLEFLPGQ